MGKTVFLKIRVYIHTYVYLYQYIFSYPYPYQYIYTYHMETAVFNENSLIKPTLYAMIFSTLSFCSISKEKCYDMYFWLKTAKAAR